MAKSYVFNPFTGNFDQISEIEVASFGASPNAAGISLSNQILTLQPASSTQPGGVSTTTQSFAGAKTFLSAITAPGLDVASTAGTDTLNIGTAGADIINIGNSGATINLQGTTLYQNVTNLQVADKLFTVNVGGSAGSAASSGMELEEGGSVTGYVQTSGDRASWLMKAPSTAGIVTVTPGASGITLNQSSHNPVTIGTANGLSLSTQQLSLGLASAGVTGALSGTDWSTFNGKQAAGNYITALTGDVTAAGPGSAAATLATVNGNVGTFGNATTIPQITVNGKGLVTGVSTVAAYTAPTVQRFTSGSGTYTTPTSPRAPVYIRVRMIGGGGGGGGGGSSVSGGTGGTGGNTTFGSSLLVANGGVGGSAPSTGGQGGTASLGTGPIGIALQGGQGCGGGQAFGGGTGASYPAGGHGAASPFGGQGSGGPSSTAGSAAVTNTGAGGGGGATNGSASVNSGGGGGAGGYVEAVITSPAATYAYAVGAAGAAGTAGTSGFAGGAGGSGLIEVTEYYQ